MPADAHILLDVGGRDARRSFRKILLKFLGFHGNPVEFRTRRFGKQRRSVRVNRQASGLIETGNPPRHLVVAQRFRFQDNAFLRNVLVQCFTLVRRCSVHQDYQHGSVHRFCRIDSQAFQCLHALGFFQHHKPALRHHRIAAGFRSDCIGISIKAIVNCLVEIPFIVPKRIFHYSVADHVRIIRFPAHQQIHRCEDTVSGILNYLPTFAFNFSIFRHPIIFLLNLPNLINKFKRRCHLDMRRAIRVNIEPAASLPGIGIRSSCLPVSGSVCTKVFTRRADASGDFNVSASPWRNVTP